MLQAAITSVSASGPSPLRDYVSAGRESGAPVDFAVVLVNPSDAGKKVEASDGNGKLGNRHDSDKSIAVPDVGAAELDRFVAGGVSRLLACYEASGKAGEITEAPADLGGGLVRLMFLGTGDRSDGSWRRAGTAVGRRVASGRTAVAVLPGNVSPDAAQAFAEGVLLGSYRFMLTSVNGSGAGPADGTGTRSGAVRLLVLDSDEHASVSAAIARAAAVAGAVSFARDLINTPSIRKSPQWLAEQAVQLAGRCGLRVRVLAHDELAAAGFGGIIAVGSGSSRPPRLIELSYEPEGWDSHVVLVGKGITFDSGGLSLKPNDSMKLMKTDMAGGAAVMAVLSSLGPLGVRAKVTGLVAAAENMPSGSAVRPGDVITHYGGRTVEVLNTDAEGRLVLADALAYADEALDPHVIVDLATLTGASRIALGTTVGAIFTGDDDLAAALAMAGEASGERLWRLPIVDEYRDSLDSKVADLANIGGRRYGRPGAIEAALFLREFTAGRSWAHLDIAGPARSATDEGETAKGGTGFGTRLLLRWLAGL